MLSSEEYRAIVRADFEKRRSPLGTTMRGRQPVFSHDKPTGSVPIHGPGIFQTRNPTFAQALADFEAASAFVARYLGDTFATRFGDNDPTAVQRAAERWGRAEVIPGGDELPNMPPGGSAA